MKVVIVNGGHVNPGDLSWEGFEKNFPDLRVYKKTVTEEDLVQRIETAEAVIGPLLYMSDKILSKAKNLKYIGCLATGYNMVDLDYCRNYGITVTNVPEYGQEMISQYAVALLLEICCQVGHHNKEVHSGRWANEGRNMFWDYPIIQLKGKTAGIIGMGRIGECTASTLKSFGMNVIYYNRNEKEGAEEKGFLYVSLEELLEKSDVIFIHCPLFPETRHLINRNTISKMKEGVILINNSRGPIVDEKALEEALVSGKIYAAALDVTEKEPIPSDNPLLRLHNCFITPHISWVAKECRERLMETALDNLVSFKNGVMKNVVS